MAIRLNKIYTRGGDDGTTQLVGGERVSKAHLRIEAYGTADELNSTLGLMRAHAQQLGAEHEPLKSETDEILVKLQNELFVIGGILATPTGQTYEGMGQVTEGQIAFLEERMDRYQKVLGPLESFVLPGGGVLSATTHVARTVCRRWERQLVRLAEAESVDANLLRYVNRLSDFLFVYARWAANQCGQGEQLWER